MEVTPLDMFAVFFSILVGMALVSLGGEVVMRVRLARTDTSRDKLAWWRRGGDEVAAVYGELFPGSRLPLFRKFVFWFFLVSCAIVLLATMWRSK